MQKLFEIGAHSATPLALAGFIAAGVFIILGKMLRRTSINPRLARLIISTVRLLSIVAMCLGFAGYALTVLHPTEEKRLQKQMVDLQQRIERLEQSSATNRMVDVDAALDAWAQKYNYPEDKARQIVQKWAEEVMRGNANPKAQAIAQFLQKSVLDDSVEKVTGMVLKRIHSGAFLMGSPADEKGRAPDEGPQTRVTISYDFWIGEYEVNQFQYERVQAETGKIIANPSVMNGDRTSWNLPNYGRNQERPVENITWLEVDAFCRALTDVDRRDIPTNYVYRPPTEAEWEYACRAGTTTRFSFGDDESELGNYAWLKANAVDRTQPVGKKRPNPWGLYDMHGNVMEWCWDWYATNLPGGTLLDPIGPGSGIKRVLRGGGWESSNPREFRCADRYGLEPSKKGYAFGFRLVLGPSIVSLQSPK